MKYEIKDHRLIDAHWRPSPHQSQRPPWAKIELVVLHCISLPEGNYGTGNPEQLFLGCLEPTSHPDFADLSGIEVSAHLFVDRAGSIQQFVAFDQQAWHAGMSMWCGRGSCNQFSIGIELEGTDKDAYADEQIDALQKVLAALLENYPGLAVDHIVGHQDIAPGRKSDPGLGLDWASLFKSLS
ncbi:MAG: 1,6-anhydro-N-acetylmuramyl-L-alanine amidase AmpD [Pseudomonadales bacterium]|nr:1,6-anhydro-N-acetylmuramyl-L-alanine amidase AmpD [Pseudomonadales bacterium]